MKKLVFLFFLLFSISAFAQEPIYTPMKGNYKFKGIKVDTLFLVPSFTDTTAANATYLDGVAGAMIRCGNDFWMRNASADAWLQNVNIGSGVSPVISFVNEVFKKTGTDSVFYIVAPHDTFYSYKDVGFDYLINQNDSVYSIKNNDTSYQFSFTIPQDTVINTTYSNLVSQISAKTLLPNKKYRITDFRTEYKILGTLVDTFGTIEPLVVSSTSDSSISNIAYSALYPNDIIYYTISNIGDLKPSSGGKGTILYRESLDSGLSAYYDWREVLWRRWAISSGPSLYYAYAMFNGINAYNYQKTFSSGCYNIQLSQDVFNVTIGSNTYSVKLNGNIGVANSGVTILSGCHDITIDKGSCLVGTSGGTYFGGIFIGGGCNYISIGKRSYNIAIGNSCYAIDLGTQQSDVFIPANTYRRRLEKGFSNFECTTSILSKTLDLYSTSIVVIPGLISNSAQYCGIANITSSNSVDTLESISAMFTSLTFQPIEIRPLSNQKIVLKDKSLTTGGNLNLGGNIIAIDGAKGEYITMYKRMINGLGTQPADFYVMNSNIIQKSSAGQNFANADLNATGNRTHNFKGYTLNLDSASSILMKTQTYSGDNQLYVGDGGGGLYIDKSSKFWGIDYSADFDYLMLRNKSNNAYLSRKPFGTDTLALLGDLKKYVDTIYRKSGKDSIYWKKNGVEYRIKDSSGSVYGGDSPDRINGDATGDIFADMSQNAMNFSKVKTFKIADTIGVSGGFYVDMDSTRIGKYPNLIISKFLKFKDANNTFLEIDTLGNAFIGNKERDSLYMKLDKSSEIFVLKTEKANTWEDWKGNKSQIQTSLAKSRIDISTANDTIWVPGMYVILEADNDGNYKLILPAAAEWDGQSITLLSQTGGNYAYIDSESQIKDRYGNMIAYLANRNLITFYSDGDVWWGHYSQ